MTVDRLGTHGKSRAVSVGPSFTGQASGGLNALVAQVAKSGNLHAKDEDGLALIHHAACRGDLPLLRKLYELGADMNLADDGSPPWRPIHYAILHRQDEAEQVLRTFGVEAPLPIVSRVALTLQSGHGRHTLTIKL